MKNPFLIAAFHPKSNWKDEIGLFLVLREHPIIHRLLWEASESSARGWSGSGVKQTGLQPARCCDLTRATSLMARISGCTWKGELCSVWNIYRREACHRSRSGPLTFKRKLAWTVAFFKRLSAHVGQSFSKTSKHFTLTLAMKKVYGIFVRLLDGKRLSKILLF